MSEYLVNMTSLRDQSQKYTTNSGQLQEDGTEFLGAVGELWSSKCFEGKAATKIHDYMDATYQNSIELIGQTMQLIALNFAAYVGKYTAMDEAYDAFIHTQVLRNIYTELGNKYKRDFEDSNQAFISTSKKLLNSGDMRESYDSGKGSELKKRTEDLVKKVKGWEQDIRTIEEVDYKSEFTEIDACLDKLEGMLQYQMGSDPEKFNKAGYQAKLNDAGSAFMALAEKTQKKEKQIETALETLQKQEEAKQADIKKEREKKAAFWGFVTDVVCTVVTVAATATLGPVGTVVTGAITGAVKSAIHEGLDQWAETGASFGELNWGKIGCKALIGGAAGAATSMIGVKADGALRSVAGSALKQAGKKLAINTLKGVAETGVSHLETGLNTLVDSRYAGKSWKDSFKDAGKAAVSDLGKDLVTSVGSNVLDFGTGRMKDGFLKSSAKVVGNAAIGATAYSVECAIDPDKDWSAKEMWGSFAESGFSSLVDEAGDWVGNKTGYKQWVKSGDGNKAGQYVSTALTGGFTNVVSSSGSKLFGTFVEKGVDGVAEKLSDDDFYYSMGKDFVKGGSKNVAAKYKADHTGGATKTVKTETRIDEKTGEQYEVKKERIYYDKDRTYKYVEKETVTRTVTGEGGAQTKEGTITYRENGKVVGEGEVRSSVDAKTKKETVEYERSSYDYGKGDPAAGHTYTKTVMDKDGNVTKKEYSTNSARGKYSTKDENITKNEDGSSVKETHKISGEYDEEDPSFRKQTKTDEKTTTYKDERRVKETEKKTREEDQTITGRSRVKTEYSESTTERDAGKVREKTTYDQEIEKVQKTVSSNPNSGWETTKESYETGRTEYQ